ncbi:MAG: alginate lyase family protein [Gemmatimonadaceae bacterium]
MLASACASVPRSSGDVAVPRTILLRGENLAESKRMIQRGDASLRASLDALLDSANSALKARPLSVMQKGHVPPSGSKHDFMSMAPYWWPDTTKPGGMPFIRRDGEMYPDSRVDHDGIRLQQTIARAEALALAHYFTGDARYSEGAARLLRVFFVDTATRMNPNLEYAQAVLGVNSGRGIGIIDTRSMPQLVDALRLLEGAPGWTSADKAAMTAWCASYLHWMFVSKNGGEERAATNNHGTFYDEQVVALALFVGDTDAVRRTIDGSKRRIERQIKDDGTQPQELERTRPLHYSVFNLDAFTMLAEMARHINVDLWRFSAESGGSLAKALAYVAPYANPAMPFPKEEISPEGNEVFFAPMQRAAAQLGDARFSHALDYVPVRVRQREFETLAFPRNASDVYEDALRRAAAQVRRTAISLDSAQGYPRITKPDGNFTQVGASAWTSGFFAGTLWYLFQGDRTLEWRQLAERWQAGLEGNKRLTNTHDLGFMLFDSFGHGYLLTGEPHYRDVVMEASRSLATRFNPAVGATKSWNTENVTDARKTWKFPVIVDNLMNLEMLFWAGTHGGDTAWARMARQHALTSARAHVRADGSTAHVALFDPATGALEKTVTWQGYADTSAWSRGQAWAIHGLTAAHGRTRDPELLRTAERAADWFIAHLPADNVPYWDFRHPAIPNTERDASAGAIAASALYDLARRDDVNAARYRAAADRILSSLATSYMAPATPSGAVLLHSTGQRPQGAEVDVGIVYADYFFVEALLRRKGMFLD